MTTIMPEVYMSLYLSEEWEWKIFLMFSALLINKLINEYQINE